MASRAGSGSEDAERAVSLASALLAGSVRVFEVTLRTPPALDAVRRIASEVPDAVVGTGTITKAQDFTAASEARARFGVSPGLMSALAEPLQAAVRRYCGT
jgi:2-dehydro-3-deoxyphosphogluconate aldolase/(4S)-4-hydroxy-2-oxoglutarate aldolase